jgi:hypothetical protein
LNCLELKSEEKVGEKKKDAMEGDIPSPSVQAQRFPCFLKTVTENSLKNRMVSPSSFSLWSLPLHSMQFYRTTAQEYSLTTGALSFGDMCRYDFLSFHAEKGSEVFCRRHTVTIVKANDMGFVFPSESGMQFY